MADLGAQLDQLTPEQRQAIMMRAKQEADQQVMQEMMKKMVGSCYDSCAGNSVRRLFLFQAILQVERISQRFPRARSLIVANNPVWRAARTSISKLEVTFNRR